MNNSKNSKNSQKKTREGVSSQFIKKATAELLAIHLEKKQIQLNFPSSGLDPQSEE